MPRDQARVGMDVARILDEHFAAPTPGEPSHNTRWEEIRTSYLALLDRED